jgi:hypothetical protein
LAEFKLILRRLGESPSQQARDGTVFLNGADNLGESLSLAVFGSYQGALKREDLYEVDKNCHFVADQGIGPHGRHRNINCPLRFANLVTI